MPHETRDVFAPAEAFDKLRWLCEQYPDCHMYALLDRNCPVADTHELHLSNLTNREFKPMVEAVLRPDFSHDLQIVPQLVVLRHAEDHGWSDEGLLRLTLRCALDRCCSVNGSYVAGWILSREEPSKVAQHLRMAGVIFDISQARSRYLPFFEPHALALLSSHLLESEILSWLGPAACWCYVDVLGQLNVLRHTGEPNPCKPARLSQGILMALSRRKLVATIAARASLQGVPRRQPEHALDDMLQAAQLRGLTRTEDLVLYVLNTLVLGAHWSQHPDAMRAVDIAAEGTHAPKLADLLDALSDQQLEALAATTQ